MAARRRPTSIELFTGAGGLALGVSEAGFEHLALVEWNADACASLEASAERVPTMADWPRPIEPVDVHQFDFRPFEDRIALLAAGAPCQPFSLGGKHLGDKDSRNLFPEVFRAVRETRPDAVIIENVKGLLRTSFREYFEYIELQLSFPDIKPRKGADWRAHKKALSRAKRQPPRSALQYRVIHQLLNAADFGLAQWRERVFVVAFRTDTGTEWRQLAPSHTSDALLYSQWISGDYWQEHGKRRPPLPSKLKSRVERIAADGEPLIQAERWRTVRDALRGLPEPKDGVADPVFQNHVGNPGARTYQGHTGSMYDWPAKTLKAGDHGVPGGENTLIRDDGTVRYLTVREAARLQGFPDEYLFRGAWGESFRQLGNAVPVALARTVAKRVKSLLHRPERTQRVA